MKNLHQFFVQQSIYRVYISNIIFYINNFFRRILLTHTRICCYIIAHRAQTHSRDLGKQGYKEARTLKLEFTLRPRHNPAVEAGRPNQYQPPRPRQPPSDYS